MFASRINMKSIISLPFQTWSTWVLPDHKCLYKQQASEQPWKLATIITYCCYWANHLLSLWAQGFSPHIPAISSSPSTTAHTPNNKHTSIIFGIPLTSALRTEPSRNLHTLPHPHLRMGRPRSVYPSISDRETTAIQPWSRRGVLFMTSPTPNLAALHWTGSG